MNFWFKNYRNFEEIDSKGWEILSGLIKDKRVKNIKLIFIGDFFSYTIVFNNSGEAFLEHDCFMQNLFCKKIDISSLHKFPNGLHLYSKQVNLILPLNIYSIFKKNE